MAGIKLIIFAAVVALTTITVSSRAVNISNTWMLPEEGFPVFYRYFRDRISWNEADAVCQFHHANLVTVDTTSQYDAIRAYLKELDIASNVWIGLSRTGDKVNFTWRDFRVLSLNDYWQEAIPTGNDPLCAAMDPAADFRWHALSCGGPAVASFICELPVPTWANGPAGCLLTELPSLTVLYIPEQSAVELTSDCGLDGTKRIACKGNTDRDDLMRRLACTDTSDILDDKTQSPTSASMTTNQDTTYANTNASPNTVQTNNVKTTKSWIWTSNTIGGDYGAPTRHRRETEDTIIPAQSTKSTNEIVSTSKDELISIEELLTSVEIVQVTTATSMTTVEESSSGITEFETESYSSMATAVETKADVANDEYPSAINQGQLFSIIENVIENGTVFDIIELNGTEENKTGISGSNTVNTIQTQPTLSPDNSSPLYTTVIYHKEPTEDAVTTTHYKLLKTTNKASLNDLPSEKKFDKALSKEVELFPDIIGSSQTKLNRTNRKELPMSKPDQNINIDVDNGLEDEERTTHKTVEIRIHHPDKENETGSTLFVTTKRTGADKNIDKAPLKKVTAKSLKGDKGLANEAKSERKEAKYRSSTLEFTTENLDEETEASTIDSKEEQPMDAEPTTKPNRQRQLTRPQRRSFYPYFFSRVLG